MADDKVVHYAGSGPPVDAKVKEVVEEVKVVEEKPAPKKKKKKKEE